MHRQKSITRPKIVYLLENKNNNFAILRKLIFAFNDSSAVKKYRFLI